MSSWKKSSKVGQVQHRERSQLASRQHLGLLEKKKDYKERAIDYQTKGNVIRELKKKALDKNPEEYYFNMVNTKLKGGVHSLKKKYKEYSDDQLKLMQTQDLKYIKYKHQMERKKIDKLQSSSHLIDSEFRPSTSHIFFVDSQKQVEKFDPVKQMRTHPSLINRRSNRLTIEQLKSMKLNCDDEQINKFQKQRKKKYTELQKRIDREKKLQQVELAMEDKLLLKNPKQNDKKDDDFWSDDENEKANEKKKTKMSLSSFNNKVIELEKAVKRSKVRIIRKLTRQIEHERKKTPDDERTIKKVKRIIDEIHQIRKLPNKDVVLFAMQNEGTIAEVLQKCKPGSDDINQLALIRLATEKSLQSDVVSLKNHEDYAKSWQPLFIMYQSRHEKRIAWKEKSQDFEKIEQALVDQQKELDSIEQNLPKPLKIKKKKTEKIKKPRVARSKQAVVCVLDLANKTAKPFGKPIPEDEGEEEEKKEEKLVDEPEKMDTEQKSLTALASETSVVINDPFFINSQHQITYQKRTSRNENDNNVDDKRFIEQSYFIDALSSSSNRRDGGGDLARKKWTHLTPPVRSRPSNNSSMPNNRKSNDSTNNQKSDNTSLHPSWEASKNAKSQYRIQKSQATKIVFNNSDDEYT
ncbi:unnamed protein product [Adineta steineri]|uniref:Probable U3 small nucleolar RNA-associated protein 11 n=1 Tax=Adineta steineri TaxID=433720 RepID=A0A818MQH9_9BILA|nr:unnamed protein product [Adineta steineri]CAF3593388.1 unnamed protein product [Adineta steineri]